MKKYLYIIPSIVLSLLGLFQLFGIYCCLHPLGETTLVDLFIQDYWIAYTTLMVITILTGVSGFWLKFKAIPLQLVVFAIYVYSQHILPPGFCAP